MRKARYLAPWQRADLDLSVFEGDSGAMARAVAELRGKPAIYHCVSRVVDRRFVLKRDEQEHFVKLMRVYERFCQVRVLTYCVMSNHFHLLLEVPAKPEDHGVSWSDERFLAHLEVLYCGEKVAEVRQQLDGFRAEGNRLGADALRQRFFVRMWDLSAFMKVLKQRFSQWFNRRHGRRGTLWEDRFKSIVVEDGHAARVTAAYIDLNPVRAGIVSDPKDYRWCGYAEAVAGGGPAREGLRLVLLEQLSMTNSAEGAAQDVAVWREVARRYRLILFEDGGERAGARAKNRRVIPREKVARILAGGGQLSETQMLYCRTRYLVDGLVIGSKRFVDGMHAASRGYFGARRSDGARKLRRVGSQLRTMRDLQVNVLSV